MGNCWKLTVSDVVVNADTENLSRSLYITSSDAYSIVDSSVDYYGDIRAKHSENERCMSRKNAVVFERAKTVVLRNSGLFGKNSVKELDLKPDSGCIYDSK